MSRRWLQITLSVLSLLGAATVIAFGIPWVTGAGWPDDVAQFRALSASTIVGMGVLWLLGPVRVHVRARAAGALRC